MKVMDEQKSLLPVKERMLIKIQIRQWEWNEKGKSKTPHIGRDMNLWHKRWRMN